MLVLPQTAEYAMRAVCYIAEHQGDGPVPVTSVARALGAPRNYLSKILHQLRALGVLSSVRGTAGGYRLGGPASGIRLARLVGPFVPESRHRCIMGHPHCGDDVACGAHEQWKDINDTLRRFFADLTLADLMRNEASRPGPEAEATTTPAAPDACHLRFGGVV
ncbi:MAG: RrF2 family transcriptional regulator [Gemmatimonadales bacterium]